jgi:hypothetical protein
MKDVKKNEREPNIVLWTDSNGRPRPVVYDKQEPRYKEDATNGGGNSVRVVFQRTKENKPHKFYE